MEALFPCGPEIDLDTIFLLWVSFFPRPTFAIFFPLSTTSLLTVEVLVESQFFVIGASINRSDKAKV